MGRKFSNSKIERFSHDTRLRNEVLQDEPWSRFPRAINQRRRTLRYSPTWLPIELDYRSRKGKKISSRRAINRDKLYVSFFYLTFCSIYYDIRGNKFKVKGGYAYGGERAGGGGMVSPWKHRCELLLRNNRPA